MGARIRTRLLGKANWYKKRRTEKEDKPKKGGRKQGARRTQQHSQTAPRTVLFVEQSPNGGLATCLRELLARLEPILGFKVKIVERCGTTLKGNFPLTSLWNGTKCGRMECITCEQEAEIPLPPCTRPSVVYENICRKCNPKAEWNA